MIDYLALAENDTADAFAHQFEALTQCLDLADQVGARDGRQDFGQAHEHGSFREDWGRTIENDASSSGTSKNHTEELERLAATSAGRPQEPPRDCGHLDIHIDGDGNWFYRGSPIKRMPLVRLFSQVLHRDAEGTYWLITPVERGRVTVADAPFLGVELMVNGVGRNQVLRLRTNLDEIVAIDAEHPLRVAERGRTGEPRPYVLLRDGLEARLTRPVFYELVERGCEERVGDATLYGVWSKGRFFPLGHLGEP